MLGEKKLKVLFANHLTIYYDECGAFNFYLFFQNLKMVESHDDISESEMSEDSIIILEDNSDEVSELSDLEAMGKKKVYCTGKNSVNSKHLKL